MFFIAAVEVASQFQHIDEARGARQTELARGLLRLQLHGLHVKPPGHGLALNTRAVGQGRGQVRQALGQLQCGQF